MDPQNNGTSQAPAQTPPPQEAQPTPPATTAAPAQPAQPAATTPPPTQAQPPATEPKDYDLKFIGDKQIDKGVLDEFKNHAKNLKLTQEQFQGQIDFFFNLSAKTAKANADAYAKWKTENEAKIKADPELGKDLEAGFLVTKKPLEKFGTPQLAEKLEKSGWNRDPDLARFLHNIGKQLGEDTTVQPKTAPTPAGNPNEQYAKRYPSMFPKTE